MPKLSWQAFWIYGCCFGMSIAMPDIHAHGLSHGLWKGLWAGLFGGAFFGYFFPRVFRKLQAMKDTMF